MKIIKQFLLISLLCCSTAVHASNWWYKAASIISKIGLVADTGIPVVASAAFATMKLAKSLDTFPDAPENVMTWVRTKLLEQGFDADKISVKVDAKKSAGIAAAFSNYCIILHPNVVQEIDKALKNPADAISIGVLMIYDTILSHELGHLKNNDSNRRLAIMAGVSVTGLAGAIYLTELSPLKAWFGAQDSFKNLLKSALAFELASLTVSAIFNGTSVLYSRYQENCADNYAIQHAKEVQALRLTANYWSKLDDGIVEVLVGTQQINPHLSTSTQMLLLACKEAVHAEYKQENPAVELRNWLTQNKATLLKFLDFVCNPNHPSYDSRVKKLNAAADAFEAEQAIAA